MFELIGEFADKPVQRPVPLRTDLKAIHTLTEDTQKASRSAYSLQLVDHPNSVTRITQLNELVSITIRATRCENHRSARPSRASRVDVVLPHRREVVRCPLLHCGGAGRPPTVARPAPTGPTPHQPHTPRDRRSASACDVNIPVGGRPRQDSKGTANDPEMRTQPASLTRRPVGRPPIRGYREASTSSRKMPLKSPDTRLRPNSSTQQTLQSRSDRLILRVSCFSRLLPWGLLRV